MVCRIGMRGPCGSGDFFPEKSRLRGFRFSILLFCRTEGGVGLRERAGLACEPCGSGDFFPEKSRLHGLGFRILLFCTETMSLHHT